MKSVNTLRVIYIFFYSLASRTRIDAVELIVRKYCGLFVLWKLHFAVLSSFKIKIS